MTYTETTTDPADSRPDAAVFTDLVGIAPSFKQIVATLPTIARADGTVLISGECGTGKDLIARAIHDLGPRAARPFVAVHCGTLPDAQFELELFGSERGDDRRDGLLTAAEGGTVLLDEIDALSTRGQVALLRVLQDRIFRPVGGATERQADVRFIAITNSDLPHLVRTGRFRVDLYYRLAVFTVALPPLRERREDVLPLVTHFVARHAGGREPMPQITGRAVEGLLAYEWPGNVRELESAVRRALHVTTGPRIDAEDLGLPIADDGTERASGEATYKVQKRRIVEAFERHYLVRLMTEHRGNVTHAARAAGKERRDLGKLLKRHGLNPRLFARGDAAAAQPALHDAQSIGMPQHVTGHGATA